MLLCVLVGHVGGTDVQLEAGPKVLKVDMVWQLCNANINEKSKQTKAKMDRAAGDLYPADKKCQIISRLEVITHLLI